MRSIRTDLTHLENAVDKIATTVNALATITARVERKVDTLIHQEKIVERVARIEKILREKHHANL